MSASIIGLIALLAVVPYLALQGSVRHRYALFDAGSFAAVGFALLLAPRFGFSANEVLIAFAAVKFVVFHGFLVFGRDQARWGANAAALFAFAVYLVLVPHVLASPVDGDEPFYVLVTESIVHDHDLDLANQYSNLAHSVTRRTGLRPQLGDPVGPHGEQYSRHEPFLPLLLIPGFLAAGLAGCVATIALFGALLVRSTLLLLEQERFSDRSRNLVAPFLAFGPPVIFYAVRIWPEVPAAWMFAEMLRGALRVSRNPASRSAWIRLGIAGLALSLIKIRFLPIAVLLLIAVIVLAQRRGARLFPSVVAVGVAIVPMIVLQIVAGSPINIHEMSEVAPQHPAAYLRGLFGSLLDAERGMLFRAPMWLFALWPLIRWKEAPVSLRIGAIASLAYLLLLLPRAEWDGGWSPPLRYLVVFVPLFALGLAFAAERISRWSLFALASVVMLANSILGVVAPWRLFHIASGESVIGEWLSSIYRTDFSRLLPSYIRVNEAAIVFALVFVLFALLAVASRWWSVPVVDPVVPAVLTLVLACGFVMGKQPGGIVNLEDAHVTHHGGALYPGEWTVGRFSYTGGWTLQAGEWASFLDAGGSSALWYMSSSGATIDVNGRRFTLPPTKGAWTSFPLNAGPRGVARLAVRSGSATFDRIEHE